MEDKDYKLENLKENIKSLKKFAVAFSGGVDSTFLLKVANDIIKDNILALMIVFTMHIDNDLKFGLDFLNRNNIRYELININEFELAGFVENSKERCYYCKKALFKNMIVIASKKGFDKIVEGSNIDDLSDYRPGIKALKELNVISPLIEAKLKKDEIRQLSKELGLDSWNKPSMACLASRIQYGDLITKAKILQVKRAEEFLSSLGFKQFRVRNHNHIARIELMKEDISKVFTGDILEKIVANFKSFGFSYVTLDLEGFRTGSLNELLKFNIKE